MFLSLLLPRPYRGQLVTLLNCLYASFTPNGRQHYIIHLWHHVKTIYVVFTIWNLGQRRYMYRYSKNRQRILGTCQHTDAVFPLFQITLLSTIPDRVLESMSSVQMTLNNTHTCTYESAKLRRRLVWSNQLFPSFYKERTSILFGLPI